MKQPPSAAKEVQACPHHRRFIEASESLGRVLDSREQVVQGRMDRFHTALEDHLKVPCKEHGDKQASTKPSDTLQLNVGGDTKFVTRRDTLTAVRGSRLAQLFSGRWDDSLPRDSDGRIFLDLDPVHFRALLNWLVDVKRTVQRPRTLPQVAKSLPVDSQQGFETLLEYLCHNSPQNERDKQDATEASSVIEEPEDSDGCSTCCTNSIESLIVASGDAKLLVNLLAATEVKSIQLLYRASRDGFATQTFHEKCDGQGPTLVVARSAGGYVFGGYTEMPWDTSNSWKHCNESFLFRLSGPGSVAASKHPIFQNHGNGICCNVGHAASFGGAHDMRIFPEGPAAKVAFAIGHTYNSEGSGGTFTFLAESQNAVVTDLEVFKVVPIIGLEVAMNRLLAEAKLMQPLMKATDYELFEKSLQVSKSAMDYGHSLIEQATVLGKRCKSLDDEVDFMHRFFGIGGTAGNQFEIVRLNVSGIMMETFRSTLVWQAGSTLAAKFSESWTLQDEELVGGGVFFDEDPELFNLVLSYLRLQSLLGKEAAPSSILVPQGKHDAFTRLLQYLNMDIIIGTRFDSALLDAQQGNKLLDLLGFHQDERSYKLLYRASRDGFATQTFHQKCDGQGPTLVVARSAGGYVFGGYTEMPWDSCAGYKHCKESFLFRLSGPGSVAPSKHPIFQNHGNGILCNASYAATFGGGHDMRIYFEGPAAKVTFAVGHAYNSAGSGGTFTFLAESQSAVVTDLEVFGL